MSERYRIVSETATLDSKELATFLARDGQPLLPESRGHGYSHSIVAGGLEEMS